jgi:hypothetical protein
MKRLNLIKLLSIVSLIAYTILIMLPFQYSSMYSAGVIDFLYYMPEAPIFNVPYWMGWIVFGLFFLCYVMLILGYTVFRYLLIVLVVFDLISGLLSGIRGQTGLESTFLSLLSLLDGALLIILFKGSESIILSEKN